MSFVLDGLFRAAWFRGGVARVLRAGGPIPRHVAIVMDGNRRFAASRNLAKESGHAFGADKLMEVLEWCLALGVRQGRSTRVPFSPRHSSVRHSSVRHSSSAGH